MQRTPDQGFWIEVLPLGRELRTVTLPQPTEELVHIGTSQLSGELNKMLGVNF